MATTGTRRDGQMRKWDGIRANQSEVGDGTLIATNVRYSIEGELQRRPGMAAFTNNSGWAMRDFYAPDGTRYVIIVTTYGTVEALEAT